MEVKDWLGEDNKLGQDIWKKKYCYENESFGAWLERISGSNTEIKQLILAKKFLFGGRILSNRGLQKLGKNVSYSNCYVIPAPQDSMADIMRCASDMAETYKTGGGCGIHLNNLRPNGASVNNSAKSSTGPICFMDLYSTVTGVVAQNGRRGALMIAMEVSHLDIEQFIEIKQNLDKVDKANISIMMNDEFMKAVQSDSDYQLYFKTVTGQEFKKTVKAREIMQKIAYNAWDMGEPGMLFWDRVNNWNLMQGVKEFKLECTNPCLTYDTPVYVADGRGNVPIGKLAEEGKDVDVFCYNKNNKMVVKKMRNPRKTGHSEQIYKIMIENGHQIKCTGNHKFLLKNGTYKEAKELKPGDSLNIITRFEASMNDVMSKNNKSSTTDNNYYWIANGFRNNRLEHRIIVENILQTDISDKVIHHRDHNGRNNAIDNLEIMSKGDHDALHTQNMIGDKNPMRRAKTEWSKEKWDIYSSNLSKACAGKKNGMFSGISNEEMYEHAKKLTLSLGYRFSRSDWTKYCRKNLKLKSGYSNFRVKHFGPLIEFAKRVAIECNMPDRDRRAIKLNNKIQNITAQGYETDLRDNVIFIKKICEICGNEFWVEYNRREIGICSNSSCIVKHNISLKIGSANVYRYENCGQKLNLEQCKIYSDLRFTLDRDPSKLEFEQECKLNNVNSRITLKYGYKDMKALKDAASLYNHKVVSIELDGFEDVYNGTVDEHHNFFVGGFEEQTRNNKNKWIYLNNLNCGELPLVSGGACLLGSINLSEYVKNPFKTDASFDFKQFAKDVAVCITELDVCLSESQDLHALQIQKDAAKYFRSIGLGVMGLAHMSIKLGLEYGSDEFNTLLDKIGSELANNAIKQSALLAKELGKAPCLENYKNSILTSNEFIKQNTTKETLKLVAKHGLRNAQLLTTAPTGSISTMIQTSGGIEPLYDCSYTRTTKTLHSKDTDYEVFEKVVEDYKKINKKIPDWIRASTAKKLDYFKRIMVQSIWQKHLDNAISSTINLPETTTVEDIVNIYIKSWELGLKGVTVFRDNCRRIGILNSKSDKKPEKETKKDDNILKWGDTIKSSDDLIGFKKKLNTGCGSLHVQAFFDHHGNFREIYLSKGSTGGCNSFMVGLSRMISLAARAGISLEKIVDQLHSTIACPSYVKRAYTSAGTSCPNALGHALLEIHAQSKNYFDINRPKDKRDMDPVEKEEPKKHEETITCPECGVGMIVQEGCISCKACGYSKC